MGANLERLVFQPPASSYQQGPHWIWLTTSRSEAIPAFHIPYQGALYTLLFSHGNAEDLGLFMRDFQDVSRQLRVNVFAYEYTGYGLSTGQPAEAAVYADIEAAFKYLRDEMSVPWQRIVPYGRSVGTAPSLHLASQTAVRGVILQSPMVSIYRIPFHLRFTLPGDLFANIDKVSSVCCPVFIIHGTRDEIVPFWHGQALHEACKKNGIAHDGYVVEGGDHNNLEAHAGDAFYERLRGFLSSLEEIPISQKLERQAQNVLL